MSNEHTLMTQKTFPISMTCADGVGIEKGAILKMSDPNTAATTTAANDPIAGIAYTEKIANDGNTEIAVLAGPGDELKAIASGTVALGDPLVVAVEGAGGGFNALASGQDLGLAALSGTAQVIGYSKEAASAGETFKYVLNIQNIKGTVGA